ncbi:MAG TPA: hypothetical protein VEX70_17465 [Pyrinomonadaceae bacterium]|jgi:hypothetical protein|nr:hypothetical protein [Pyrinomonadaceae bacterium]
MRRSNLAIAILFVLLAALPGAKADAQTEERVQLRDGRVSFVLPAGFKPMSKEAINVKFARKGAAYAPEFAYSNERQNVSVAVGFAGSGLQAAQLDELRKFFEAQFETNIPGVEWIEREIITRNGTRWIHLHLKAKAIDTGIINDMYATVFDGQMLFFNFNSTIAQYEKYKESLLKSAQTITVK